MSGTDAPEDQGLGATQMHDCAIAAGLVERPERVVTDDEFNLAYRLELEKQVEVMRADRTAAELAEAEEDGEDDDELIAQLRAKRIEELKAARAAKLAEGQTLPEVDPFDFEQSVIVPSKQGFVVLLVYRANHSDSALLQNVLRTLAAAHPQVMCKQMHVSQHIANLPPQDCPVLLVYRSGRVVKQFVGLASLAGRETNKAVLEWVLADLGVLDTPLEEDPRLRIENARKMALKQKQEEEEDSDSDDD
jgi:hypothetical protein